MIPQENDPYFCDIFVGYRLVMFLVFWILVLMFAGYLIMTPCKKIVKRKLTCAHEDLERAVDPKKEKKEDLPIRQPAVPTEPSSNRVSLCNTRRDNDMRAQMDGLLQLLNNNQNQSRRRFRSNQSMSKEIKHIMNMMDAESFKRVRKGGKVTEILTMPSSSAASSNVQEPSSEPNPSTSSSTSGNVDGAAAEAKEEKPRKKQRKSRKRRRAHRQEPEPENSNENDEVGE